MPKQITGIAISGNIVSQGDSSNVAIILIDRNNKEYLIYENYELLNDSLVIQLDEICEETCILSPVTPASIYIKGNNVQLNIKQLNYTVGLGNVVNINKFQRERKKEQNSNKIDRINQYIKKKKLKWIAGPTSVSEYSYEQKLQLFEGSTLPPGIEYYSGGIIEVGSNTLKSASSSPMVDKWDWRDRHG